MVQTTYHMIHDSSPYQEVNFSYRCDVSVGYVDPHIIVDRPVIHTSTIPAEHKGYVTVSSKNEGTYTTCLQATTLG